MQGKFNKSLRENGVVLGNWGMTLAVFAFLFGIYMAVFNSGAMLSGDYKDAANTLVADRAIAMYDAGLDDYQQQQYKQSVDDLQQAYNECLGAKGVVSDDKRKLAGDIKFLTGNALVMQGQLQQAVEAYKDALRMNPDHMFAKYNLEMLQSMNGGKGPGDGQGQDPNQPGAQPGKGIKRGI